MRGDRASAIDENELEQIVRAIWRSHLLIPTEEDLESLPPSSYYRDFGIGSLDEAKDDVRRLRAEDERRRRIGQISVELREVALSEFLEKYCMTWENTVSLRVKAYIEDDRVDQIGRFLADVVRSVPEAAYLNSLKVKGANRSGQVWDGLLSLLEVAGFILVLRACQPGFQVLAVSIIAFAYCNISFAITTLRVNQVRLADVAWNISREYGSIFANDTSAPDR